MKMETKQARTGSRPALRGTLVLMLAGGALFGARNSGAVESISGWLNAPQQSAQQDTVHLNALMTKLRGVDPVVCNLVGRSLDHRFGGFSFRIYAWESLDEPSDALIDWINRASVKEQLVPVLRRNLSAADGCIRRISARLLGRAEVIDLSAQLKAEMASTTPHVREAALMALGHFDRQSGMDEARQALKDADASVRVAAAWALGMIEHSDAVPALTDALADGEIRVRIQAAFALGQIESETAVPALIRLLENDRDPRVRRAAAAALGQISG